MVDLYLHVFKLIILSLFVRCLQELSGGTNKSFLIYLQVLDTCYRHVIVMLPYMLPSFYHRLMDVRGKINTLPHNTIKLFLKSVRYFFLKKAVTYHEIAHFYMYIYRNMMVTCAVT